MPVSISSLSNGIASRMPSMLHWPATFAPCFKIRSDIWPTIEASSAAAQTVRSSVTICRCPSSFVAANRQAQPVDPDLATMCRWPRPCCCEEGVCRATAFQDCAPAGQRWARCFAAEIVSHFRKEIRDRLLGRYLVGAGIVDSDRISKALHPDRLSPSSEILRLLMLLDTEAWIAHWPGS